MAKRILILLVLAGVLIGPEDVSSCGPFLPETVFTSKAVPLDEPRYFSGKLDIVQPHYWRIYLIAAYRYLSGVGLSKADQQTLVAPPAPEFGPWSDPTSPAIRAWLDARVQVGAPPLEQIQRFELSPDHYYFVNCGDDAFRNAAATLVERGHTGASHDDLRAWVAAQDQVFANCSHPNPPSVPTVLPASATRWMQADRAYQIAAAEFYAGEFAAASADFLRIGADRTSPWHGIAPYLAARALIRNATLVGASPAPAQEQLQKVLADPDAAPWHDSARDLSRYLRIHTEPERALDELAHAVAMEKTGVAGAMNDYRLLLDHFLDRGKQPPLNEDISDWVATMQNDTGDRALAQWRAKRSLPWLVAALTYADKPEPDLMAAAAQVPESSPAFMTVEFHRLRLLPPDEARPELDTMVRRKMPLPARNMYLAERMRAARDWDELLGFAPRTETAIGSEGEQRDDPVKSPAKLYFDDDAAHILNRQAPLAALARAARSSSLPPNLQLEVARAVWVRSILLNDTGSAREIAPVLSALAPYLKPYLDGYLAATDERARGFAAAWLMLNNPGMRPTVDSGSGRTSSTPLIDTFRDNWWCASDTARQPMHAPLELLYQGDAADAEFASAAERSEVRREQARLAWAPAAPTLLARGSVEWVEANAGDPRAAEALRLVVRAGHYACGGDADTDRWVKRAFRLLHGRYAKSEAARRTPYWFGAGAR